ncbi:MAG: hypothetical protein FJX72_18465 [Armatimonadetes bacterium]|nr:hypothetical protein [Armatimonadota bacterium]
MAMQTDAQLAQALVLTALWSPLAVWAAPRIATMSGLVRTNFLGRPIPTACGSAIVLGSLPGLTMLSGPAARAGAWALAYALVLAGFGLLGLADDRWGTPAAKGLRGHVRKLICDRRVTSGLMKAVGGALVAVIATRLVLGAPWPMAILQGAVIALSANAANLLDLRPGRASAVSLVALGCTLAGAAATGDTALAACVACVAVPAALLYVPDARGRLMMGDTGSNALGAAVGLGLVLAMPGVAPTVALLAVLVGLHIVAERRSLSSLIESNRVLRTLDRMTGVRAQGGEARDAHRVE